VVKAKEKAKEGFVTCTYSAPAWWMEDPLGCLHPGLPRCSADQLLPAVEQEDGVLRQTVKVSNPKPISELTNTLASSGT